MIIGLITSSLVRLFHIIIVASSIRSSSSSLSTSLMFSTEAPGAASIPFCSIGGNNHVPPRKSCIPARNSSSSQRDSSSIAALHVLSDASTSSTTSIWCSRAVPFVLFTPAYRIAHTSGRHHGFTLCQESHIQLPSSNSPTALLLFGPLCNLVYAYAHSVHHEHTSCF